MAVQASGWWEKGIRCALALALGCAPRVATLPVNEPERAIEAASSSGVRDTVAAATPAAASDPLFQEDATVEYWVQKDHPSRPCPDASVGTERCLLMTYEAVNARGPRLRWSDEPRQPAPEELELVRASEG